MTIVPSNAWKTYIYITIFQTLSATATFLFHSYVFNTTQ